MTAAQFKAALHKLDLSVYAARKVLGLGKGQPYRYAQGKAAIPVKIERLLLMMVRYGVPEEWR